MNTCFVVKAEFATSPILSRRLNFDALLAHLLYEKYRAQGEEHEAAIEHAHSTIPLSMEHGVVSGSSALVPHCDRTTHTFIQSFYNQLNGWENPEEQVLKVAKKTTRSSGLPSIPTPLMKKFQISELVVDDLPIHFLAKGDIDKVRDLLQTVTHIGKKRGVGFGKLRGPIKVTEAKGFKYFGIMSRNSMLLRPVIEDIAIGLKPENYRRAFESASLPYWGTEQVLCYVPRFATLPYDTIEEIIEDAS